MTVEFDSEQRDFLMSLLAARQPPAHGVKPGEASAIDEITEAEYDRLWNDVYGQLRTADVDTGPYTAGALLLQSRQPLARLRELQIVRSANAPAGDFAEWLVAKATGGTLAPQSQKGWDVETSDGRKLQVKARFVSNPIKSGQRQLSTFRSFDFDDLIVVLLDDQHPVARASCIPRAQVEERGRADDYVGGKRVTASDALLDSGENWTERLQEVASMHLDNYSDSVVEGAADRDEEATSEES
jgi:hypothetical protein